MTSYFKEESITLSNSFATRCKSLIFICLTGVKRTFNKRYKLHYAPYFCTNSLFMLPNTTSYVPYYRVSTARQGQSGLGLEAQRAAVAAFVGDPSQLLGEFIEVESGKKNQRPQLLAAITAARAAGATLLIAKLDRLTGEIAGRGPFNGPLYTEAVVC
jgi:hypothetical protein